MTELARVESSDELIKAWLGGKASTTIHEYGKDLRAFAAFLEVPAVGEAAAILLGSGPGPANALAHRWRAASLETLAPNTVKRRLTALRSLVTLARRLGLVTWTLDVEAVKVVAFRDTTGCAPDAFARAVEAAGPRNRAILSLLGDRALRAGEVVSLRLEDVGAACGFVWVLRKGDRRRTRITLSRRSGDFLAAWIGERGTEPGSLFGLTYHGLWHLCKAAGFRPHQLRHMAASKHCELSNGNVRETAALLGHANVATTMVYLDASVDLGGKAARLLAGETP